jgi:hypothetical protein
MSRFRTLRLSNWCPHGPCSGILSLRRRFAKQITDEGKTMATRTIKFFNDEKGFGFISPENGGVDVFVVMSG